MELNNEFLVSTGVDDAWRLLTDVARIAPCMPGVELQEIDGEEYRGVVKVKVGPIVAQYKGKATFLEQDETSHKAVLKAEGRDVRGQGNAGATITATLTPEGEGTQVKVVTDLTISGPAAQLGRGVLVEVSTRLLGQFVSCLESEVLAAPAPGGAQTEAEAASPASGASDAGPAAAGTSEPPASNGSGASPARVAVIPTPPSVSTAPAPGPRSVAYQPAEPVGLPGTAGAPVVKRVLPALLGILALWFVRRTLRGRD
jgi:uncharacterized protein